MQSIHAAALEAIASAGPLRRPRGLPDNIAIFGKHKVRPLLRAQPLAGKLLSLWSGRGHHAIVVKPAGGEPGRPHQRALARAYAEDAARRAPRPAKVIVGTLPKWTKLDRGSLRGGIGRHTQRI